MALISIATTIVFTVFAIQQSMQTSFNTTGTLFRLEIRGHRFQASIWKTIKGSSLIMCAASCHLAEGCNSFQYHKALQTETDAICELLEPDFDNKAPSVNPDFNIYSRRSHETTTPPETTVTTTPIETTTITTEAPTTTMRQRMTPVPRNCEDLSGQIQCTYNQDIPKRTIECTLKSTVDNKFVMYIDDNISWDDSTQFCSNNQLHLSNIKDMQFECNLNNILKKMAGIENLENKGFIVGFRKNANEYWKFADGTDVIDFPELYAGPGPVNTDIQDKLCGYVILDNWNLAYKFMPCDINKQGNDNFIPVCTTA